MLIGFFDSGVGGITVLHDALQALPNADFIYYADTDNVPYGTKTKAQVKDYVMNAADFLVGHGAGVLVVACNTATSVAIKALRQKYDIPIIGMEPAVKPAVENHKDKRILVTATALALKLDKLKKLITTLDCEDIVDLLPLPGLVRFAEDMTFDTETVLPYLREELSRFDMQNYQTVVLGCTHFIYFRHVFRALLGGEIELIDGNQGTVNMLVKTLDELRAPLGGAGKITWYQSGAQVTDEQTLQRFEALLKRLNEAR
ncbi:glutamate racemase [Sporobacter termitidis DSM 10068]|uniref:Glutamate racemase n=1 Tax=Sporobacter termitidis DSM 10068 TaxID=1123282 RepID=A0A1M5ZHD9_9FIRM|nr:glutamate racemase [Sporobacter termitidis]SHI23592.1 glutamate racemase [Sporobacter termitidis DSM 10068]